MVARRSFQHKPSPDRLETRWCLFPSGRRCGRLPDFLLHTCCAQGLLMLRPAGQGLPSTKLHDDDLQKYEIVWRRSHDGHSNKKPSPDCLETRWCLFSSGRRCGRLPDFLLHYCCRGSLTRNRLEDFLLNQKPAPRLFYKK